MASEPPRRASRLTHERHVMGLALLAGLPAVAVALLSLWLGDHAAKVRWTLSLLVVGTWWGMAALVRERVVRPLQTLSNMLAALHERDYSLRARGGRVDDALGLAMLELNTLAEHLRVQRLGAIEATALLQRVMEEIDIAVLAFDDQGAVRLANRAAERLLGRAGGAVRGRLAADLGLGACLGPTPPPVVDLVLPGGRGRFALRRSSFRLEGRPHALVVLPDVSRALRDEERSAWQRLVRVLGHEINNSLTPIKSVAESLIGRLTRDPGGAEAELERGLTLIRGRAEALGRFLQSYARLARLPPPRVGPLAVETWVRRVVALETRRPVAVRPGPQVILQADGDQLDQLLINLVRNAVDATLESGGAVEVRWSVTDGRMEVVVADEGPGLPETANLFVPFFTTKAQGTGLGLTISREIAEAHGGTLTLTNRTPGPGCEARLMVPVADPAARAPG
jgi:nitrogen fixation/metabolism regulation signal transduction histidine kinase